MTAGCPLVYLVAVIISQGNEGVNWLCAKFFIIVSGWSAGKASIQQYSGKFTKEEKFMKKIRKGFTLVELLIVIAVLGSLGAMMSYSSSGAVDSADAAKIISNLQSLKIAALQMYIEEPEIASKTSIVFNDATAVSTSDTRTIAAVLGAYLGKKADALTASGAAKKYGLVGDASHWYVVYALDTDDSAGVKAKLAAQANAVDLYAWQAATIPETDAYYTVADTNTHVALKVR